SAGSAPAGGQRPVWDGQRGQQFVKNNSYHLHNLVEAPRRFGAIILVPIKNSYILSPVLIPHAV
ncbi:MAG: hypothetical protein AB2531_13415, partial [Candidatus Thiodiazotropha sp.]